MRAHRGFEVRVTLGTRDALDPLHGEWLGAAIAVLNELAIEGRSVRGAKVVPEFRIAVVGQTKLMSKPEEGVKLQTVDHDLGCAACEQHRDDARRYDYSKPTRF